MTDDKAIDAAWDYLDKPVNKLDEGHLRVITKDDLSAALAAADKVRAEREFDFIGGGVAIAMNGNQNSADDVADVLRRAFAAGLAKGEAERAALVEALTRTRQYLVDQCFCDDAGMVIFAVIDHALSLVRKGV